MKNLFFLFLTIIFLSNCAKTENSKTFKSEKIIKKTNGQITPTEESFDTFFIKFAKDSIFQSSRINFPIKVVELDSENLIEQTITLTKDNYYFQNIKFDSKDYEIQKEVKNSSAKVILKGIENGIFMEMFFIKTNQKWNLKTWNNFST